MHIGKAGNAVQTCPSLSNHRTAPANNAQKPTAVAGNGNASSKGGRTSAVAARTAPTARRSNSGETQQGRKRG